MAAILLTLTLPASAQTIEGRASVIDEDSIEVKGVEIRLEGIDAPEARQRCRRGGKRWRCGNEAAFALDRFLRGKIVSCVPLTTDRYGRTVANCRAGEDVGAWMVRNGWALAYRKYSRAYVGDERKARAAGAGIWAGDFIAPWLWRRGKRLPPPDH